MSEEKQPEKAKKKVTEVSVTKPRPGKIRTAVIRKVCCGRGR
jgi:hypothetical protein